MGLCRTFFYYVVVGASFVQANTDEYSSPEPWYPPGPDDARGPCPMLNTLANHGYLPRDGKNITVNNTVDGLGSALNIDAGLSELLFDLATRTNPVENSTTFSLNDLSRHNILEHDASLSRADFHWNGDTQTFNESVFNETRSYWTGPTIDLKMAQTARLARIKTSNTTNPEFTFSQLGSAFSLGETAAYIGVLGDIPSGTVPKELVEFMFEKERLPTELGWKKPTTNLTMAALFQMMGRVQNAV